jgi:hypothetical protein
VWVWRSVGEWAAVWEWEAVWVAGWGGRVGPGGGTCNGSKHVPLLVVPVPVRLVVAAVLLHSVKPGRTRVAHQLGRGAACSPTTRPHNPGPDPVRPPVRCCCCCWSSDPRTSTGPRPRSSTVSSSPGAGAGAGAVPCRRRGGGRACPAGGLALLRALHPPGRVPLGAAVRPGPVRGVVRLPVRRHTEHFNGALACGCAWRKRSVREPQGGAARARAGYTAPPPHAHGAYPYLHPYAHNTAATVIASA